MLPVLARSVAFDIWENAVIAGLINALWVSVAFLMGIAWAALSATAPTLAILLIAASAVLLIALLGPIGAYLEMLARRETPDLPKLVSTTLRGLGGSMLIALGGLAMLSLMVLTLSPALRLPDTIAVAAAVAIGWACFMTLQWMMLAIGHCGEATVAPMQAAREAAVVVLSRPVYSAVVLIGVLISFATLVILLPGPSGAALLARRAARLGRDPKEFDRTVAAMSRRTTRSVLFPWKS